MRQTNDIQEAIQMIENHDWFWMMADYGYEQNRNSAQTHMKSFVKLVASIADASVREMLRDLWTLRWEAARNTINGKYNENNQAKQEELIASLTCPLN